MGYGVDAIFPATMASAGTLTSEVNLSRAWGRVYLEIPSMTSNTQIHIQGAYTSTSGGGTYRRIYFDTLNSSTVGTNVYAIASAVTNAIVPIPPGIQFVKVETTATVNDGCTFRLICSDES
jgi:hypothetical protein